MLGLGSIGGSDEPALPETVCDKNVQAVMEDAYQVYALFYGTVQRILRCTQMQACLARLHKLRKKIRKASKARREWHRQSSVGSVADALDSEDGVRAIIALALHCPRRTELTRECGCPVVSADTWPSCVDSHAEGIGGEDRCAAAAAGGVVSGRGVVVHGPCAVVHAHVLRRMGGSIGCGEPDVVPRH